MLTFGFVLRPAFVKPITIAVTISMILRLLEAILHMHHWPFAQMLEVDA